MTMDDLSCLRDALRERLWRMRAVIAPKKDSSVGEAAAAVVRDGDVEGNKGDIWPDDCVCWESKVDVRMGGVGWKED